MTMGWRELKAARERRELKRATESLQRARRDLNAARYERDNALRSPMLALKREAMSYLAGRVSDAMARATDERVRKSIGEIERASYETADVSATTNEWDRMTVFRVDIPRSTYHFTGDIFDMARRWR